jgi:glycerol-3-phosphate acyltransferase PlsY
VKEYEVFFVIVISYLIGSIPFGVVIGRLKGVNLRKVGSGNIGATNALRAIGKAPAILVLVGDMLKGTFAVLLCRYLELGRAWEATAGLAAIVGHLVSIYLFFKGGKGVATGFGVFVALSPLSAIVVLCIWLTTAFISKYSSLAAVVAYLCLLPVISIVDPSVEMILLSLSASTLILLKHIGNIERIITGKESKIGSHAV